MGRKKKVPDKVSATLDYDLAVALSTHVEQSEEFENRADFVREALWEKLVEESGTSEVLDHYIEKQQERVRDAKWQMEGAESTFQEEKRRLKALKETRDETVEEEADEFFEKLENAEPEGN